MKEYIEKAAVENMLETAQLISDGEYCGYCTEDVSLNSIPAADVREVRRGRWIRDKWPSGTHKMICSECSEWSSKKSRYCPSCGARMDKEDEHETS